MIKPLAIAAIATLLAGCAAAGAPSGGATTSSAADFLPDEPRLLFEWYPPDGAPKTQYLAAENGLGAVAVTSEVAPTRKHVHSDWSPDGTRIAFEAQAEDGAGSIWIADADGTNAVETIACESSGCLQEAFPSWSPDGKSIVFVQGEGSGDVGGPVSVIVMDLASRARRDLVVTPDGTSAYYGPRWSPDGTRIVAQYETYADETEMDTLSSGLAIMPADGSSRPVVVTPPELFAGHPDWSRTEDLIVFGGNDLAVFFPDTPGPSNLFTMRPDGSELRQLTTTSLDDLQRLGLASWTPDGSRIVATRANLAADKTVDDALIVYVDPTSGAISPTGIQGTWPRLQPERGGR